MKEKEYFNDFSGNFVELSNQLIPPVRDELKFELYEDGENSYLLLFDPKGYAIQPAQIPDIFVPFLQMLDGTITWGELYKIFEEQININFNNADDQLPEIFQLIEPFYNIVNYLDYLGYLQSERFQSLKKDIDEYITSPLKPPVCAGNSYSANKEELISEIETILSSYKPNTNNLSADLIIVPHIDYRIGTGAHKAYSSGYHALKNTDADLFVIFGTSHYASSDYFMLTKKNYYTPFGIAETDTDLIDALIKDDPKLVTIDDMAHKNEHSIELQLVLIQHLFRNRAIKVLPVLVGSFANFIHSGQLPSSENRIMDFLNSLKRIINQTGRRAAFIASVDFAHIGRKFGDDFDASQQLEILKTEDSELIKHLENCDPDAFFQTVAKVQDQRRICGLSPIYSLLKMYEPKHCKFLHYHQWDEKETNSAVSFASLAFY